MLSANSLNLNNHLIRFLLVGILNTIIGLSSMFILFNLFDWSYWLATFTGNTIGTVISYILNRSFSFNSTVNHSEAFPRFLMVIVLCYTVSYSASGAAAKFITIPEWASEMLSSEELCILFGSVLYTITNYIGQKGFVFRRAT